MISKCVFYLSRFYTRYVPHGRGKSKLVNYLLNSSLAEFECISTSKDGRSFLFNSKSKYGFQIFFFGEREVNETMLLQKLLKQGDTVFDVGANIGWYTTLFSNGVGKAGMVVAIEAVPQTFDMLRINLDLNDALHNVQLLNLLCSDSKGEGAIFSFPKLHPGLASAVQYNNEESKMDIVLKSTLDNIVNDLQINHIAMLKVDVEGAEYEVLRGAEEALRNGVIKSIMIEANDERALSFGYEFEDCLKFALECVPYFGLFRILKKRRFLQPITIDQYVNGDNLLLIDVRSEIWARLNRLLFA